MLIRLYFVSDPKAIYYDCLGMKHFDIAFHHKSDKNQQQCEKYLMLKFSELH